MKDPTHEELIHVATADGKMRFCLDKVHRMDGDKPYDEFAFVWRGSKVSPNTFNKTPAYFSWDLLAELLGQSVRRGIISKDQLMGIGKRALFEIIK